MSLLQELELKERLMHNLLNTAIFLVGVINIFILFSDLPTCVCLCVHIPLLLTICIFVAVEYFFKLYPSVS